MPQTNPDWPKTIDEVEPSWMSEMLQRTWPDAGPVESFESVRIGTGQVGECWRLDLVWRDADSLPESVPRRVVVKVAAQDPTSREAGRSQSCYRREVGFYSELASSVDVRTPHCHFAAIEDNETDHLLVLEDMAPARQGDQLQGCSLDQATAALVELARLQGPRWNDPALLEIGWLERPDEQAHAELVGLVDALHEGFLSRYQGRLVHEAVEVVQWLATNLHEAPRATGPLTLVHNDFRVDNMLFGDGVSAPPVTVVDWQTLKLGNGPADAAYFLGAGLPTELRRAHERELLRTAYWQTLVDCGVDDYEFDRCWNDYRRGCFGGVLMAMIASMLVGATERGDEMFLTMARRHARHALDLDAAEAVFAAESGRTPGAEARGS